MLQDALRCCEISTVIQKETNKNVGINVSSKTIRQGDKAAVHQRQSDETSFCRFKFDGKRFGPLNMQHLHTHNTL